ncbi:MAG: sigma-70 family RNA polymerase sigma factor [Odoribacteraceae bacterium]|jgi:RNA polymerase sigma-70 factor (ECF subfamily)|nr:sigma-70 family RNA polymerase sigma factor [Odoribacteraceae bacterium]
MIDDLHIQRVSRGDWEAFRTLHEELYDRLFYYTFKLTHNRMASEDIVQEAFMKFWENRETFTSLLAVKVYLFSTLKNKIMTYARDESNRKHILDSLESEDSFTEEHLMIIAEIRGQVQRATRELPDRTRQVIEMGMAGMTVEEIAARMGISQNTVKTLKKSGYQSLRDKLRHLKTFLFLLLA